MKTRQLLNQLILGVVCATLSSAAYAEHASVQPQTQKTTRSVPNTIPYDLHDEYDKTDILMVPIDNDEYEDNLELETLDELQKPEAVKPKVVVKPEERK